MFADVLFLMSYKCKTFETVFLFLDIFIVYNIEFKDEMYYGSNSIRADNQLQWCNILNKG